MAYVPQSKKRPDSDRRAAKRGNSGRRAVDRKGDVKKGRATSAPSKPKLGQKPGETKAAYNKRMTAARVKLQAILDKKKTGVTKYPKQKVAKAKPKAKRAPPPKKTSAQRMKALKGHFKSFLTGKNRHMLQGKK